MVLPCMLSMLLIFQLALPCVIDVEEYDPTNPLLVQEEPDGSSSKTEESLPEIAAGNIDVDLSTQEEKAEEYCPENNWSLDFPPGRVDLSADVKGGQWKAIQGLLKAKRQR